jgi:antitoxin component YwqK of YwqJK toxin-antitoxin module
MTDPRRDVRVEHHATGAKKTEVPLEDGLAHGLVRAWHVNGTIHFEVEYRRGVRHGTLKVWYENGQLESVRAYVSGKKHGPFTDWHRNGVKAAEGEYREDALASVTEWDEHGRLVPQRLA